jgi:hypothetical protein
VDVPINYEWRACLMTILSYEDGEITDMEKSGILLDNVFPFIEEYPVIADNIEEATRQAVWFLNGGEDEPKSNSGPRVFSFSKDSGFIFAAFRQTHGVDLETAELHWWKFLALFMDIGGETTFSHLVSLRKRLKTGKATKEEIAAANEMREILDMPQVDDMTIEQREALAKFDELVSKRQEEKKRDKEKSETA